MPASLLFFHVCVFVCCHPLFSVDGVAILTILRKGELLPISLFGGAGKKEEKKALREEVREEAREEAAADSTTPSPNPSPPLSATNSSLAVLQNMEATLQ